MGLHAALVVLALGATDLTGQDLLEGLRYREELVADLALEYQVETRIEEEAAEIHAAYKRKVADVVGKAVVEDELVTPGTYTTFYRFATDGLRFRLSQLQELDGELAEATRLAYDGKVYRTFVPGTGTGQVVASYSPLHDDPAELGLTVHGERLSEVLAAGTIDSVVEDVVDGVPCYRIDSRRPHPGADGAWELARVWVDPRRGFTVLRGEFGGEVHRGTKVIRDMPTWVVEVQSLEEISPGLFYPTAGVLSDYIPVHLGVDPGQAARDAPEGAVVDRALIRFKQLVIRVDRAQAKLGPEDSVAIDWPLGTQVLDTVANELFIVGGIEDELKAATERIKAGAAGADAEPVPRISLDRERSTPSLEELDPDRDCGLRALYLALGFLDLAPDWDHLRQATADEREAGLSLKTLRDVAQEHGAHALGVRVASFDALPTGVPAILYFTGEHFAREASHSHEGVGHFMLALKAPNGLLTLYDPLESERGATVSEAQLAEVWKGEALLVSNEPIAPPGGGPKAPPWVWLALLALVAGAGLLAWVLRSRGSRRRAATHLAALLLLAGGGQLMAQSPPRREAPSIHFEEAKVDLGRVWASTGPLHHSFRYSNAGSRDLHVSHVQTSCECTAVWEKDQVVTVPPGESSAIDVTFDPSGRFGRQKALVAVHSDDPENPVARLELEVIIEQDIAVLPNSLFLGTVATGQAVDQDVEVHLLLDAERQAAELEVAEVEPPWLVPEVEGVPVEEWTSDQKKRAQGLSQRRWVVHVGGAPAGETPRGGFDGVIRLRFAGAADLEPVAVAVSGAVVAPVFATPGRVLFGVVDGATGARRQVRIQASQGRAVEIARLESDLPYLRAEVASGEEGSPVVVVHVEPGAAAGRLTGAVTVYTTSSEKVIVPVSAIVE